MIPYGRQSIDDDDVAAVEAVLRSDWLTQGPAVAQFESALARRVGAGYVVAFSSGTTALHAACLAAGLGPGDVVATSPLTFVASASCARAVGAEIELVDIDPATLNLDVSAVPAVDALIAVHYAGLPVDLAALDRRHRVIIEDAAHALGATTPDGPVGSCPRSDLSAFSFHPVKAITTGEGGAVSTNDPELAERLRRIRHHGLVPRPADGGWACDVEVFSSNLRLSDIHAALGRSQLDKLDRFIERRRALAESYRAVLADTPVGLPPEPPPGFSHAYHLFPVRVSDRRAVYDAMRADGIGVQVHYVPLHHLGVFAPHPALPNADAAYAELLSLPLHPALTDTDQDDVIDSLCRAVGVSSPAHAGRSASAGTDRARSEVLWERALAVIPEGSQTKSKRPNQFARGTSPIFLEHGRGAHVWDVDGNRYLDYPMALGPVLLGYAEPVVDDAIRRQLTAGITFTLPHALEVEVAERIVALCPGVEAVRFVKTGSEALSAAVRVARALTGRDHVLVAGYHGWHGWYAGTTSRGAGVPDAVAALTTAVPFDDLPALDEALAARPGGVAAVVLEPSGATVPSPGYLAAAVERARAAGALAVFDEVICGFRVAPGGARERYGVHPDLSCYGKALGNGMPIAAVAGAWTVMRAFEDVFVSGTHGGEALSLAAARAVLDTIADGQVLAGIEAQGLRLGDALTKLLASHGLGDRVSVGGEPQRSVVSFTGAAPLADRTWIAQALAADGILFNGSMFITARHTDADIDATVDAFDRALTVLREHEDVTPRLTGPIIEPVF